MRGSWLASDVTGVLEQEMILLHLDVPVLFVCRNEAGRKFLTLCLDEEEGCYIMAELVDNDIVQMLEKQCTIEETFRKSRNNVMYMTTYNLEKKRFDVEVIQVDDVLDEDLPDKGAFFTVSNNKIERYLKKLKEDRISFFDGCTSEKMVYSCSNKLDKRPYEESSSIISSKAVMKEKFEQRDLFEPMKYLIA